MQNKERFLDASIPDDLSGSIRPRSLSDFIGHDSLKQNLSVFVSGARARGEAMDHVLLYSTIYQELIICISVGLHIQEEQI